MTIHRVTPPAVGTAAWLHWFRSQRPWKNLRAQVRREEPTCWLRLPGCTTVTTTADHIVPASVRPELALVRSNVRGACHSCNSRRSDKHPHHPDIHRVRTKPIRSSTAAVLKRAADQRRPSRAVAFFEANNGQKNGRIVPKNGDHPLKNGTPTPKQWRADNHGRGAITFEP